MQDKDDITYMTLGYNNGPGFRYEVVDKNSNTVKRVGDHDTPENLADPNWVYEAGVRLKKETHGGEDVAVYARGIEYNKYTHIPWKGDFKFELTIFREET